ncbi:hypothetical protein FGO68_gene11320 [Halteria grandinella]|uniref:Uncharacterized protein n=1 Tax=Halteria grandinella TaxID=5974 RepID=A0A8J8NW65_HALGN|nr:hypothetical protein FGO68_gene11320 [Halteria grandinella]
MSNWAANPQHQRQSLMTSALPHLLFTECHRYCVNNEFAAAETVEEKTCLNNCQQKTYAAFDLFMGVSERMEARKNFRAYVDVSRFTGMEVEHKHDTGNAIPHNHDGHIHPKGVEEFNKQVGKTYSEVQKKALQ